MDIQEVERLANWYIAHYSEFIRLYQEINATIEHNAHQSSKIPVQDNLRNVIKYLMNMDFEELSIQQIHLLDNLEVTEFLGPDGARFIELLITTSGYDPATALSELTRAINQLNNVRSHFDAYIQSLKYLGINGSDKSAEEYITIRVGFQRDASIDSVTDWKESAKDWYDIIRGLALASDEAPEDTKIVGASTGSIILILAGTLSVTTLLALIAGRVAAVAKHGIEVANQIEDLRHKKLLNKAIERELTTMHRKQKEVASEDIMKLLKERLIGLDGEKENALEISIRKLLEFNEKGGNIDFVSPDTVDILEESAETEGEPSATRATLSAARAAIHDYQEVREQLKLLSDHRSSE